MNYKDSWKSKEVFEKQLALNEKELTRYPYHWNCFLTAVKMLDPQPKSILDVGCGCGALSEVCKTNFPDLKYKGVDYSEDAIDIASSKWGGDWEAKDYRNLNEDDLSYDLLHAGALLDVLPDADEAFEFLCGLGFKNLIFGRMKVVDGKSYSKTYEAYDLITTYAFYHNQHFLHQVLCSNGYNYSAAGMHDNWTLVCSKQELTWDQVDPIQVQDYD